MSQNLYESVFTRNARLAKFSDQNPNIALVMMKVISYMMAYAAAKHINPKGIVYECFASPDGKTVMIKMRD